MRHSAGKLVGITWIVTLISTSLPGRAEQDLNLQRLYPFVADQQWGFINETGEWAISPRFQLCSDVFEKDRVRAWLNDHWGYIDRKGFWLLKPQFTEPILGFWNDKAEIVCSQKKKGLLDSKGRVLLPVKYDDLALDADKAWVLSEDKLGLFGLNGEWILKPSIKWPRYRGMPIPKEGGVAWFQSKSKWGLLSPEGKILFGPEFEEHVLGRREYEEWNHPEGTDFVNGTAWVSENGENLLINTSGKVLVRSRRHIIEWPGGFFVKSVFPDRDSPYCLVDQSGKVISELPFNSVGDLQDGRALVSRKMSGTPDAPATTEYGFINEKGEIAVPLGKYARAEPFSQGMAVVYHKSGKAGFINVNGEEIVPLKYRTAASFHNGCAVVSVVGRPRPGMTSYVDSPIRWGLVDKTGKEIAPPDYRDLSPMSERLMAVWIEKPGAKTDYSYDCRWGYIDESGKEVIPPQFGWALPFCRGRAWVLKPGQAEFDRPNWALIDRSGKLLTDFAYVKPDDTVSYHRADSDEERMALLIESRWRGECCVLRRTGIGLAKADGTVIAEPKYNYIGEFQEGMAVATEAVVTKEDGNVSFVLSLISKNGEVIARGKYAEVGEFTGGVAWARREKRQSSGWGLIDKEANELTDFKYARVPWVRAEGKNGHPWPDFVGDLAPVRLVSELRDSDARPYFEIPWGYINRSGTVVAWHDKVSSEK